MNLICSLYFASWLCFPPIIQPIIYEEINYTKQAEFTAYNSVPGQTDGSPCIGASNHDLCAEAKKGKRICASRNLPLHTILDIEGIGRCEVLDRTSAKVAGTIDIFFDKDVEGAIHFGRKTLSYAIIK